VKLVVLRGNKSLPLLNQQDENSLETKLFNFIKQGTITSDEDAASALYGDQKLTANYRMLKSRMRKKLFNQLYYLEFPADKYSLTNAESIKVESALLKARVLITANEYKLADKLIAQAIDAAKASQLTSCMVRALELRLVIHSTVINKKPYQETYEELQSHYHIEAQERAATGLFQRAHLELGASVSIRNAYMPQVPEVLEKLQALWLNTKSTMIYNAFHVLSIFYLELQGDFKAISDLITHAEQLLAKGEVNSSWFNHKYNSFIRVYALLRTRQYESGLKLAKDYIQQFEPNTINWFAFMENYLLLALHAGRYSLAGELLHKSLENPFYHEIQQPAKERWELYRRYLLLISSLLPRSLQVELPKKVFVELIALPKDKVGYNLSLLVLDIIKSFSSRNIDDYESQAERIKKYTAKHLRGEKAERARLFLRLLLLAMKKELDFIQTKEAGKHMYEKLCQTPPPGDAYAEVEIVPYEQLWEAVLIVLMQRGNRA